MLAPAVLAEPPPGWVEVDDVARPPLGDAADASFTSFRALRAPDRRQTLVLACAAAPIPGWVEDMRPSIEGRAVALAGATASRVVGSPIDARAEGLRLVLRIAGGAPAPVGEARTSLGFTDDGRVVTCVAVCARSGGPLEHEDDCVAPIASVRFVPGAPPPPAGLGLRAVSWAVHHPHHTAAGVGAIATAAAVLAVVTRRRPRTRI